MKCCHLANRSGIPEHEIDALARHFLPQIIEFFQDENNMKKFEEWKAKREQEKTNGNV